MKKKGDVLTLFNGWEATLLEDQTEEMTDIRAEVNGEKMTVHVSHLE